jgi:uncharacterized membrane protein YgcG
MFIVVQPYGAAFCLPPIVLHCVHCTQVVLKSRMQVLWPGLTLACRSHLTLYFFCSQVLPLSAMGVGPAPPSMYASSSAATSSSSTAPHLNAGPLFAYGSSHSPSSPGVLPYPHSSGGAASSSSPSGLHTPAAASSAVTFRDGIAAVPAASGQYIGRHSTSSNASPANVATMGSIGDPALLHSREPSSSADVSGGGSGGRGSGQAGAPASASGGGASGGAGSSAGQAGAVAARGISNVSSMLKARSEVAVLRDLKIGPLLGRGSYGRVYKGECCQEC